METLLPLANLFANNVSTVYSQIHMFNKHPRRPIQCFSHTCCKLAIDLQKANKLQLANSQIYFLEYLLFIIFSISLGHQLLV